MKKIIGFVIFIFIIFGIYLILNPLYLNKDVVLNLSDHRNYYSIIGAVFSFSLTVIGLLLGYFYYFDNHKKQQTDKVISYILDELHLYDKNVERIFFEDYSNQKELIKIRSQINRLYENIQLYLEEHTKLLKFSTQEIQDILAVHSYVEKSDVLMLTNIESISEANLLSCKDLYIEKILKAKRLCINKLNE